MDPSPVWLHFPRIRVHHSHSHHSPVCAFVNCIAAINAYFALELDPAVILFCFEVLSFLFLFVTNNQSFLSALEIICYYSPISPFDTQSSGKGISLCWITFSTGAIFSAYCWCLILNNNYVQPLHYRWGVQSHNISRTTASVPMLLGEVTCHWSIW